jgi:hypothetical protein
LNIIGTLNQIFAEYFAFWPIPLKLSWFFPLCQDAIHYTTEVTLGTTSAPGGKSGVFWSDISARLLVRRLSIISRLPPVAVSGLMPRCPQEIARDCEAAVAAEPGQPSEFLIWLDS